MTTEEKEVAAPAAPAAAAVAAAAAISNTTHIYPFSWWKIYNIKRFTADLAPTAHSLE